MERKKNKTSFINYFNNHLNENQVSFLIQSLFDHNSYLLVPNKGPPALFEDAQI